MRKLLTIVLAIIIVAGTLNAAHELQTNNQQIKLKEIKLRNIEAELKELDSDYQTLREDHTKTIEQKQQEIEQLKQREKELQTQLQARQAEKARLAKLQTTQKVYAATPPVSGSRGNCGDNVYKQFIYQHESGCDTNRWNSIGCYGIGQACPSSKIAHCGADFACQDAWFSNYAIQRYGSWEGAYQFWLAHRWW